MKTILALILVCSHAGHWLSGRTATVTLRWPAAAAPPAATLRWDLRLGTVALAAGAVDVPDASRPTSIEINVPAVRVVTDAAFTYRLTPPAGEDLARGDAVVHLYPDDRIGSFATDLAGRRVVVLDRDDALASLLRDRAGLSPRVARGAATLGLERPDVLLVAPGALDAAPLAQPAFDALAGAGAQVIVFRQDEVGALDGYALARRRSGAEMRWRVGHPLLQGLSAETLDTWAGEADRLAVRLPADAPVLEIGSWAPEVPGETSSPQDALVLTKTVGGGRVVLCQLPATDWKDDPRSQTLLANALAYATVRPEPTPPPSQRASADDRRDASASPAERVITIPAGAHP